MGKLSIQGRGSPVWRRLSQEEAKRLLSKLADFWVHELRRKDATLTAAARELNLTQPAGSFIARYLSVE